MVRGLRRVGEAMMAAAFAVAAGGALHAADVGCDPTKLEFKLLATRRFMLDNEVTLSEFVPGESARPSLQNPLMPYCANPLPKLAYGNGAVTLSAPAGTTTFRTCLVSPPMSTVETVFAPDATGTTTDSSSDQM